MGSFSRMDYEGTVSYRRIGWRLAVVLALVGLLLLSVSATAEAAPPANDNFADAQELVGLPATTTGTNVDATAETNEPNHGYSDSANSVWYQWTATSDGSVAVDLSGSDFDTLVAIYTGSTLGTLTQVGFDDDNGDGNSSRAGFSVASGETYRIVVAGYSGASGWINISIEEAGSISGTVTDASSDPISNICVDVFNSQGDRINGNYPTGSTDNLGTYSISGLPTGNFRVRFSDCFSPDSPLAFEYYDNKSSLAAANQVAVIAGSDTSGIDAELSPGGSISGTVTDSSNTPLQLICVMAYDSSGAQVYPENDSVAVTDSSGNYRTTGLPAGSYRLQFRNCLGGSNNVSSEFYSDKASLAAADQVAVTEGSETTGIDVELGRGGSISGTIYDIRNVPLEGICAVAANPLGWRKRWPGCDRRRR